MDLLRYWVKAKIGGFFRNLGKIISFFLCIPFTNVKIDCFCFQTPLQPYFHHCVLLIVYVYCQVFNGPQKPSCRTLYCIVWHIAIQYTLPILFFDKFMYSLRTFFEKVEISKVSFHFRLRNYIGACLTFFDWL